MTHVLMDVPLFYLKIGSSAAFMVKICLMLLISLSLCQIIYLCVKLSLTDFKMTLTLVSRCINSKMARIFRVG